MLEAALHREIAARAEQAGAGSNWPQIRLTGLRVRRSNVPDWWTANGNLLLAASDAAIEVNAPFAFVPPADNGLVVAGAGVQVHSVVIGGTGGLVAVGDQSVIFGGTLKCSGQSTILIGEGTTSTFMAELDAYNDGAIVVGADGMWASAVQLLTDDFHAIRDLATHTRLNVFGGRIIVGRHVWLCREVRILGDCIIGEGAVLGLGSIAKGALPANSVCVGRPAKPVRRSIYWSREDKP